MWNGHQSPTEEFKPTKGLKQGDLLALFLFLIVAEGLSGLVRQAVDKNLLKGIKVGKKGNRRKHAPIRWWYTILLLGKNPKYIDY